MKPDFISRAWHFASSLLTVATANLVLCPHMVAQEQETLLLLTMPLDSQQVAQFWSGDLPADGSIVAANTISQTASLTAPSLWWAQQQFGSNLLNYWVAYPGNDGTPPRVELLVDQQVWNQTSYINRYAFVNQIGTAAKDFGYSVRVFTWRGDLVGAYVCDFELATQCDVFLGLSAPGAFQTSPFIAP